MTLRARRAAAVALVLLAVLVRPGLAAEVIERFDAEIVVRADGVLAVAETIRVRAEGDRIRRGIFRDFPLTFIDAAGDSRRVSFRLRGVERDGRPEAYHTERNSRGIRIYAGDADVLLEPGVHTYRIRYETGRQIRFLAEHTELFWNVTGNDWAFPILAATARLRLPGSIPPVRWTAYTGRFGERGQAYEGAVGPDGVLTVSTTAPLDPGSGLSVVAEIADGVVAPPTGLQRLHHLYLDNRRFVFGGLGLLGVLAFYLAAWQAVGRDPPKGTIIPLFHPPAGISPALAGYVRSYGWSGGWRAFTAAAVSLAVKGLLVFDQEDETIVLRRTAAKPGEDLPPGERTILAWVDGRGGTARIERESGASLASTFAAFKSRVEDENRHRFFRNNRGYFFVGLGVTAAAFALVLAFGDLSEGEVGLLAATVAVGVFLGASVAPFLRLLLGGRSALSVVRTAIVLAVLAVLAVHLALALRPMVAALPDDFAVTLWQAFLRNSFPFAMVGGFAALNGLFYYLLRAPTAAGREVMDAIEGLDLYIRTAESERLNLAGAPELTPAHFERLLPYAIVLGAERPWSEAFAAAFARANPGADATAGYRPAWHGGRGWGGGDFGRSVASAVSASQGAFASAVPAPRSSSSGFSGGGSGGGGGGGGGGGW